MRHVLFAVFLSFATATHAEIPKPVTLADTLDLMIVRVQTHFPDAHIDRTNNNIRLDPTGGSVMNPDNIHSLLRTIDDGTQREEELDRFIATIIAANAAAPIEGPIPRDMIYPVVRHHDFARTGADTGLYFEPFLGDMVRLYAIDYPDYASYVTDQNIADGLTVADLHSAAATNLARKLDITQFHQNGGFYFPVTDGFYESSLILDAALWADIANNLGGDLVAVVPARDLVVFALASDADAINTIISIRDDTLVNGAHPLSALAYIWRDGAWQVFGR